MTNLVHDTPDWRTLRDQNLERWFLGNTDAIDCFLLIGQAFEVWDDLIDCDKPVTHADIHGAFLILLFELPGNRFYQAHQHHMRPLLMVGINAWMDANELERERSEWSDVWAYALRDWYFELFNLFTLLIGGFDQMRAVSLEARRFFQAESYTDYVAKRRNVEEVL